jgi:hypothetical protein
MIQQVLSQQARITMTGLNGIITDLEQQKKAIDNALAALRGLGGATPAEAASSESQATVKRRGGITPEGKERLRAALRRRWAAKKRGAKKADGAVASPAATTSQPPASRKRAGMSAEGRQKLAEAMKRRWAAKRTAAQAGAGKKPGKAKKSA